jgi:hypothetical protein
MPRFLYIVIFLTVPGWLSAQQVSGSWFGHADVDATGMHNNYMTELVIKQKGTHVEGIFGYYFRDKYQSYYIHGRYDPKTREITILNIPVIFYGSNSTVNSIDCITNFRGVVIQSKMGSTVKGTFFRDEKYKYLCPDIKVSYELDKSENHLDSAISQELTASRIWRPQADDYVVDATKAAPPPAITVVADSGKTIQPSPDLSKVASSSPDSVKAASTPPVADIAAVSVPAPNLVESKKIEESFARRKAVLNTELEVESDSVRLSFYDNGEIDGDSISVFVNHQLVLSHLGLEAKAFNLFLRLDSTRELNEISMFAENLGRIPPNTALMVITDGKNRYEVFMSSSLTENATVQLRRKRP